MERLYILYRFFYADFLVVLVDVKQMILVISHTQLFHVGELAQAVAGLHALYQGVMVMLTQGVYQVYGRLIHGQNVSGGYNTDVRGDYRLCCTPSQSQDTDMLRRTLIYTILSPK